MTRWLIYLSALLLAPALHASLQIIEPATDAFVFSGKARPIEVTLYNSDTADFVRPVDTRLYQATSSTLAPIGDAQPWKNLHVLAGQKIIESASFDFPEVRTVTAFQVRWLDGKKQLGKTTVQVCPTNLLSQISVLASNKPIAVLDPLNELKPLLKESKVKYRGLDDSFGDFAGELAIVGPFNKAADVPGDLTKLITHATKPTIVVWIQQMPTRIAVIPNVSFFQKGRARIAVVDASLVADLNHSALAQINLLRCIKVAQHRESITLPNQNP